MSNGQLLDATTQLVTVAQLDTLLAQSDSLMVVVNGFKRGIYVLLASVVVMLLINLVILLTSRKRGRGHHYGHDRRPGGQTGNDGKPDNKGQGGAPRRQDGGQRKPGGDNGGGGRRQGGQQGGRPQQERGGRSGQAPIDPVEMSLRDINQRLKNAEREQDNARKSIRDGDGGGDGEGRGNRDGRQQQRGGRDGRDGRGGNRDDRGPRRDSNRDNRGGRPERQDRGDGGRPQQEQDRFRQSEQGVSAPQERPQAPEVASGDTGVSDDYLQHGRRFTAKRRMLPDGAGGQEGTDSPQFQPTQESAPAGNSDSFGGQEQSGAETIRFGR